MHSQDVKHTLVIFEYMHRRMPPLVPEEIVEEFSHVMKHLKSDYKITIEELDETVVVFGKKIWPYWKAFYEFFDMTQGKLGEKFLLGKLPRELKKKYQEFKEHGGSYHDLRTGEPLTFFEPEERQKITSAFIEIDKELRQHAQQTVVSTDRQKYEDAILEFQEILDNIEKRLETLRTLAEDEEEHPQLAMEIREQIKSFEFGMCLLGPNTKYHEVFNAEEYFIDRKGSKKLHRFK